ncbi:hypothetical protein [Paenibacillus sp. J2TS4]|uniref:hypothetical protein n=1 Tax=Paenibacillus sp. J2TS4 TaxID=2807194 RepID=UPI001B2543EA|nr:hypothetical protein [Paenibacillus sp. J2TS4]GIP35996.1 hypothetical protein J2TS4_52060 [Paenibacillus sp. J2TS4]
MTKFIIGLSRTLLIAALASGFTLYFTWTIVHTYVDKLIASFNLPIDGSLVQFSDLIGSVAGDLDSMTSGTDSRREEANGPVPNQRGAADSEDASTRQDDGAAGSDNEALPVFGQSGSGQETQAGKRNVIISPDDLSIKKDQLNEEDKKKIFSYMASLPPEDLQKISVMMEGGITEEEMTEIQKIVEKTLKPEEYNQLMDILQKY